MPMNPVSTMDTFEGSMPAIDAYNRIVDLAATKRIITKAADYTCLAEESGAVYTATTGIVTFTLPAVTNTGWHAWFVSKVDETMTVAGVAGTVIADGDAAANSIAFSTGAHKIGGMCEMCSDGSKWLILQAGLLAAVPTIAT